MKRNICGYLSCIVLSSCLKQAPAPIEFGSSKTNYHPGYSERTSSALSDSDEVTSRELAGKRDDRISRELEEKDEAKPFEEVREITQEDEKTVEKEVVVEEKKLKSLEEELEELEAAENTKPALKKPQQMQEDADVIMPDKISADNVLETFATGKFAMPVSGKIVTRFGDDIGGKKSNGINIAAPRGTGIKSIAAGKVVYSGEDPKFGNLIIVKVGSTDMFAAYAHMEDLLLHKDDAVTAGQVIGHVGTTGKTANPELHFALRRGKTPVDPMDYLIMGK